VYLLDQLGLFRFLVGVIGSPTFHQRIPNGIRCERTLACSRNMAIFIRRRESRQEIPSVMVPNPRARVLQAFYELVSNVLWLRGFLLQQRETM
jgi:hypothetical protein